MEISPYLGVGDLRFGQNRESVRGFLGAHYRPFRKSGGLIETDAYDDLGLHLYYDERDQLELVEGYGCASLSLQGTQLLGRSLTAVENDLAKLGYSSVRQEAGSQSNTAGIALYAPADVVEAVSIFRRDYYYS